MESGIRKYFDDITQEFNSFLGYPERPVESYSRSNWINLVYKSPIFRHIHLQYYNTDRISIIHANLFANPIIDFPILGIDLIEMGGKTSGFFFDITQIGVNKILQKELIKLKNNIKSPVRILPEWANFFGDNFICVTPEEDEVEFIILNSIVVLRDYLENVKQLNKKYYHNIKVQNDYCIGQKKNQKTFKALAADIGDDNAKHYLDIYMFPEINE